MPVHDEPSLAVLPFVNLSGDPEQEYFADGIAEDIITAVSRYPSLFVIARTSCFAYKGRGIDMKQVGRELGARYVLEGSLRKGGNRIRVAAQLIEAESGNHIWAERYDSDLADIFAVQDEITNAVAIAIAPAVADAELRRAMRKPPESLDAWVAYQRGLWHLRDATRDDTLRAVKLLEQAIDLDPTFSSAYAALSTARAASADFEAMGLSETADAVEAMASRRVWSGCSSGRYGSEWTSKARQARKSTRSIAGSNTSPSSRSSGTAERPQRHRPQCHQLQ